MDFVDAYISVFIKRSPTLAHNCWLLTSLKPGRYHTRKSFIMACKLKLRYYQSCYYITIFILYVEGREVEGSDRRVVSHQLFCVTAHHMDLICGAV